MNAIVVKNSVTLETLYEISETSEEQVQAVYQAARQGFQDLKKTTVKERVEALKKVRDAIYERRETIVDKVILETGKSRTDALVSEAMGVLDYADWLIANAPKILADEKAHTPIALLGKKSKIYHEALGVVLIIAPWNYPFNIAMVSILTALAAGNSVVFKPSEITPLNGLIEEVISAAPLFRQCVNVVYGTGLTAQRLIDQRPAKIFFTGSARTGKKILSQAANYLIPVELELGGKDQMIVFDDVNIERTVAGCLWGAMTNAGQSCTSVERVYVHQSIYHPFVEKLKEECAKLVVNSGDDGDADIGGITADFQLDIIRKQVDEAKAAGAKIIAGGEMLSDDMPFYLPTIIEDATTDMTVLSQETFGPVITISAFSSEQEVIAESNNTEFGLSASVWSKDLKRGDRVARALEVGAVSINNVMLTEGNPALPFGGTKQSGFGRVKGAEGLLGMTQSKAILVDTQSAKIEANWYPYTRAKYALFSQFIDALFGKGLQKWVRFAISGIKLESESQKPRG
ncbi:aldehyde dehydrogenase family protein [Alkalimarinus alittae]|uniref:Aldehyde dehydrogenase n=1 Tax=Alkalimarinus alittae TaxID=2961619 RepID=A0ABY6N3B4_9ALTE|nr:aldehyde dehydrogenase family protein [Alkalimarinus alittae]UZE96608.1 aldehyde dehydrogenase family protein [Alkalimarinus alittae]